jgi:hypothetical protein
MKENQCYQDFKFNRILEPKGSNKIGPKNANEQYFSGESDLKIDTLIRETIQNPLDHPISDQEPVEIVFKELFVEKSAIPYREELKTTIDSLLNELKRLKVSNEGLISTMIPRYFDVLAELDGEGLNVLQISDYNTKGLTGSRKKMKSNLGRFLGADGYFDDDSTGGGSGGLGKFAPFQVSELGFCMYSSYNVVNEYIYYGWAKYFSHKVDKKYYTGELNIGSKKNDVIKTESPIEGSFMSHRKSLGTDVYAFGFSPEKLVEGSWIEDFAKAVIKNFFGAIVSKKLVVKLENKNGEVINLNHESLAGYLNWFDDNRKKRDSRGILSDGLLVEAVRNYLHPDKEFISTYNQTPTLGKGCCFKISLRDDYSREVTFMRGPKMFIRSEKYQIGDLPFTASFECSSKKGNNMLRKLEDSKHREWKFNKSDEGKKIKKEIKKFIELCIEKVAMHEVSGEFSIAGNNLISIGASSKNDKGGERSKDFEFSKSPSAVIIPKDSKSTSISKSGFGSTTVVDSKGRKKTLAPKKSKYSPPGQDPAMEKKTKGKPIKKRENKVEDFKAVIFKNDNANREYHLFIESDDNRILKDLKLDMLQENGKVADIDFVEILKKDNEEVKRNEEEKKTNHFEDIRLKKGMNKFVVKTRFDKQIQITLN